MIKDIHHKVICSHLANMRQIPLSIDAVEKIVNILGLTPEYDDRYKALVERRKSQKKYVDDKDIMGRLIVIRGVFASSGGALLRKERPSDADLKKFGFISKSIYPVLRGKDAGDLFPWKALFRAASGSLHALESAKILAEREGIVPMQPDGIIEDAVDIPAVATNEDGGRVWRF